MQQDGVVSPVEDDLEGLVVVAAIAFDMVPLDDKGGRVHLLHVDVAVRTARRIEIIPEAVDGVVGTARIRDAGISWATDAAAKTHETVG